MTSKAFRTGLLLVLPAFVVVFSCFANLIANAWLLATGRGYFIPDESSMRDFVPVVMNEGSGEWWIYGEDSHRYYYAGDGVSPFRYVMMRKAVVAKCPGFQPTAFSTWCAQESLDAK